MPSSINENNLESSCEEDQQGLNKLEVQDTKDTTEQDPVDPNPDEPKPDGCNEIDDEPSCTTSLVTKSIQNNSSKAGEDNDEDEKGSKSEDNSAVFMDHGWAWLIVVGCSAMHLLVGGVARSYSIIYMYLTDRFGSSAAITAWVGGACSALRMGASPIATALVHRFSCRSVVFVGGLFLGLSGILSAFAPSTEYMFFSYSFLSGVGGALVYSPAIVIVGQYFNKYRSIAIGLSTAGSGVGVFLFPPFFEYLLNNFSFFGGMLIMGAISFNNCVCGALYRAPGENVRWPKKSPEKHKDASKEEEIPLAEKGTAEPSKKSNLQRTLEVGLSTSSKSLLATHSPALQRSRVSSDAADIKHRNARNTPKVAQSLSITSSVSHEDDKKQESCCNWNNLYKYLDVRLFKNPTFICYITCLGFITMSYISGQMLIPPYAKERGVSQEKSVWLLSAIGISDTIGRVGSGLLFNVPFIKPHRRHYYTISILISGLTHFMWAMSGTYMMFLVVSALHGLFTGIIVSQRAVICIDLMGVDNLPSSFGLTVFIQGLGILIGPALAGLMKDLTDSYFYSYILTGLSSCLASLFLFAEWLFISRQTDKSSKSSTNQNSVKA